MSALANQVDQVFSDAGPMSQHIVGYRPRAEQRQMAAEIVSCLSEGHTLVVEAGTGVGKTFGYLIPALLSGKSVIVSTGSKNLQEQLFYKDLPALLKMLKLSPKRALLKGRNNYLCQLRLAQQMDCVQSRDEAIIDDLLKINQWAGTSHDGDLDLLTSVPESSAAIDMVRSTRESCTGQRCAFYGECHTRKARLRAMDAKITVVNHHLFFADRVLKDTGFAELLPHTDMVIFDEAHLLPDIAVTYFGQQCSGRVLNELVSQIYGVYRAELMDTSQLGQCTLRCIQALSDWHNGLFERGEADWRALLGDKTMMALSWKLMAELDGLASVIRAHLGRSDELDDCLLKLIELADRFRVFFECENPSSAYSIDLGYQYALLRISPINVERECAALFDPASRWIFTSATLQVNRSIRHFTDAMGITDAKAVILDSPFDYQRQALFCVPRHLPNVMHQQQMARHVIDLCTRVVVAADGRTFILFTSHRMMELVAAGLREKVLQPVLVQGQGGKQSLLDKFRRFGNAVLLGTGSFWEGVDVRGKLLSCVVIDKLPFVSPDDPLYKARADAVSRRGGDPFVELSLPQAVIALKQGAGRLIRDERDKGVLILCDNRIVNRDYGAAFVSSLPPMARTRDLSRAIGFLSRL
ncbi:MAG: ATP-dependent DNA helicase [Shewanella sp.]|nr:ATP-dependent DNA helicase [Shewanella sp.]MCF1430809.1 ATP-dependent DNA helicase [Shewanella sp.]MCF1458049.1 ATP-dependent DNA helicase [Shewanella sp.]